MADNKAAPDPMQAVNIDDGRMLVNTLGTGLALGAGSVGIQQLIKHIRSRMRRKTPADQNIYAPVYSELPLKQANSAYERFLETIGKNFMPKEFPQIIPGGGSINTESTTPTHLAMRFLLPPAVGAAGVGLGALTVKNLFKSREDAVRNRSAAEQVQAARQEYFNALTGNEENTEKKAQSLDTKLDALYAAQKSAAPQMEDGRRPWYSRILDYTYEPGAAIPIGLGLGAMGVGGLYGGTLAYYKRKAESQRKANAVAEEARARLRGISPPWIDPKELAALKQVNVQQNA